MDAVVVGEQRHSKEDLQVVPARTAFAALLFEAFDHKSYWYGREKPWRRLSRDVSKSPQTLERICAGAEPKRITLERLAEETGIPFERWLTAIVQGEMEKTPPTRPTGSPKRLQAVTRRLPPEVVERIVDAMLLAEAYLDRNRRREPRPTDEEA